MYILNEFIFKEGMIVMIHVEYGGGDLPGCTSLHPASPSRRPPHPTCRKESSSLSGCTAVSEAVGVGVGVGGGGRGRGRVGIVSVQYRLA